MLAAFAVIVGCTVPLPIVVSPSPTPRASARPASTSFDADRAEEHLHYLADPARKGRLTGSTGYGDAATYMAERFREVGLEPAGDHGTFFQHFPLAVPQLEATPVLEIRVAPVTSFRLRTDFTELVGGLRGGGDVEASAVYIGGGADSASYSDFADVDVAGKVALVAGPNDGDPGASAIAHGARAVLLVSRDSATPLIHYSFLSDIAPSAVPTLVVTEDVADQLLSRSGKRIADLRAQLEQQRGSAIRRPLSFDTGISVRVSVQLAPRTEVDAVNVVGVLRPPAGASDRFVVVGGHLDGVGTDPDGTVYPAANDNASGPAVTIEVARAVAAQRENLRDGVVFVAWAGEEEGLRGSMEFLRRGAGTRLAPSHLAAYINLDVVGCCGNRLAASQDDAALYNALAAAARKRGVALATAGGSSDHESFTRAGIPAAILVWAQIGSIHTTADTARVVDVTHLGTVGNVTVQAILDLAGAP